MGVGESQAYCAGVVSDTLAVMTYRQWLVGMAMQGILSNEFTVKLAASEDAVDTSGNRIARMAITAADAVLSELEKQT